MVAGWLLLGINKYKHVKLTHCAGQITIDEGIRSFEKLKISKYTMIHELFIFQ